MNPTEPEPILNALRYVKNTNLGATREIFIEDHDPVGVRLWLKITDKGFVTVNSEGKIHLTPAGELTLSLPLNEKQ